MQPATCNQQPLKKAMSKERLASLYKISSGTLCAWFRRAGLDIPKNVKILTPAQLQTIYEKLGEP